jgi:hypothetical protein
MRHRQLLLIQMLCGAAGLIALAVILGLRPAAGGSALQAPRRTAIGEIGRLELRLLDEAAGPRPVAPSPWPLLMQQREEPAPAVHERRVVAVEQGLAELRRALGELRQEGEHRASSSAPAIAAVADALALLFGGGLLSGLLSWLWAGLVAGAEFRLLLALSRGPLALDRLPVPPWVGMRALKVLRDTGQIEVRDGQCWLAVAGTPAVAARPRPPRVCAPASRQV